ncbi:hemolysin XhlA family protein [Macrococcus brunensis]|uniref:hemolysin XhlA family protein n=1 Tax=Macrococcus brunensis TaxID=198483 RepID=UPI001EF051E4|nr:hemolysin XhlA family protein [Macrococcus brunensis]ULG73228.1 hemolysin XhlA family protein [Macrococcus brunensis]
MINRVKDELLYTILVMMLDRQDTHATRLDNLDGRLRKLEDKDIADDKDLKDALKKIEEDSKYRRNTLWSVITGIIMLVLGAISARIFG